MELPTEVDEYVVRLASLRGVTAMWVGGSLATGDYTPSVSDVDLVALTDSSMTDDGVPPLARETHAATPAELRLGCVYVDRASVADADRRHPTYTHGRWISRPLSRIARAELLQSGWAFIGDPPGVVLAPMGAEQVRAAARAELNGYWAWARRRPSYWLSLEFQDLALATAARAAHMLETGELLTKSAAIESLHHLGVPPALIDRTRARRSGRRRQDQRVRGALVAWRLVGRVSRRGTFTLNAGLGWP